MSSVNLKLKLRKRCPECRGPIREVMGATPELRDHVCINCGLVITGRMLLLAEDEQDELQSVLEDEDKDAEKTLAEELVERYDTALDVDEPVERFNRSPVNPGMLGKNQGTMNDQRLFHQIVHRAHGGGFKIHRRSERIAMSREKSVLRQKAGVKENPNDRKALNMLSRHSRKHLGLDSAKYGLLGSVVRSLNKAALPDKEADAIASQILEEAGYTKASELHVKLRSKEIRPIINLALDSCGYEHIAKERGKH